MTASSNDNTPVDPDEAAVASLVEFAGEPAHEASADEFSLHHSAALMVWKRQLRERRRRRITGRIALLAAALLLTLGVRFMFSPKAETALVQVASLERMLGTVEAQSAGGWQALQRGAAIETGTTLRVRGGAAALSAFDASLRVAAGSQLQVAEGGAIRLDAGRLYIDTEGGVAFAGSEATSIAVETALGVVRDIGTQFEVDLDGQSSGLEVRVRTGLISIETLDQEMTASAGESLRVSGEGDFTRASSPTFGTSWDWVQEVSRPFELDDATLTSYLRWLSAETGWAIEFADPALEREATTIRLSGSSTEGLEPSDTVQGVLDSTGLRFEIENGVLTVN